MNHSSLQGVPVLPFETLDKSMKEGFEIVIGIGYAQMNQLKKIYIISARRRDIRLLLISPPKHLCMLI